MANKQCPNCLTWVTDEERLSGQCPNCNKFFESEIPGGASNPYAAPAAPVIQTHTPETPTRRAKRTSGLWSAWWVIPIALIGMRACRAVVRTSNQYETPSYEYELPEDFDFSRPENEALRRLLEDRDNFPSNEFRMGPDSEPTFDHPPQDSNADPFDVELPEPEPFRKLELKPMNLPDPVPHTETEPAPSTFD